ncbi:MAG: C25 family cysteine peptidase [Candidatus Cloacimonadales bacterium]|nr:C25 family cysteine peptidase [Candidatus Cloacimonadales bacterium]
MRKKLLIMVLLISGAMLFAANGFDVFFNQPSSGEYELNFVLDDYHLNETVQNGVIYSNLDFEGSVVTTDEGYAELPFIHATLQLSASRNVSLEVVSSDFVEYDLDYPMLPSRGIIYRNQDPAMIPYEIDPASITDEFYPANLAEATDPFILRSVRGTNVYVYPFQYNAAKNVLRVYTNLTVRLTENNTTPINPLPINSSNVTREMHFLYGTVFLNYDVSRFEHELDQYGSILTIYTARDADAIAPWIQWKREKGYTVYIEEVATNTIVTSLVQTTYDNHNDILYVQLVGDWADIKGPTSGGAATDPNLGCVVGGDAYPDLIVGRFSANSAADVTVQVDKSITYEQTPQTGETWYSAAIGIASNQGPGDDGELDYVHIQNIYDNKLDPFTYDAYSPIYDPSANQTMVANAVNAGASIINYCGHGSMTSWGSSGFSNSNVNALTNGDKLPFILSVACVNGAFDDGECFAEAWLKKAGGGAVGFYGATINQSWDPPMRGEDYIDDLLIGGYDYSLYPGQNGITTDVQKTTYGAMCFNGSILMTVEDYGGGQPMLETWHVFGDASLQVRTDTPAALTLSNQTVLMGIDFSTIVTANGNPVEGAMVSFFQDDEVFCGLTDASGSVTIPHTMIAGDAQMTVTAFNTETIYEVVSVISPNNPYVVFESCEIDDSTIGNGNGELNNSESVYLNICMENIGSVQANNVVVSITTDDPYITIVDGTENYGNIAANSTATVAGGFTISAAADIPDDHQVYFELEAVAGDTWISNFSIVAYAPMFPPENLSAEIQNFNDIVLTWDQPSGSDNSRDLLGYKVYKDGLEITEIIDPVELTYTDAVLPAGVYEYYITALFHVGESDPSEIETVELILPVPRNLQAATQGTGVFLSWDSPASRDFTHYKVYRNLVMIANNVMETTYLDPDVPNGTYTYNIRAVYSGNYQSALSGDAIIEHVQTGAGNDVPARTELYGNYPNPFNPATVISFALSTSDNVTIDIYNIKGAKVATILNENLQPGYHTARWEGKDTNNRNVASGIYFYKMHVGSRYSNTRKMILLK